MRNFKTLLEKDMNLERQMLKFIAKELKTLPDGSLKTGKNGKAVYENDTKCISAEGQRALKIARRHLLEQKKKIIEKNLKAQEKLLAHYTSYRDDRVLAGMRPVYQKVIGTAWAKQARMQELSRIEAQETSIKNGKAFHAEHLRHRNVKGEIVRSKSEYIFAMQYDSLKIPYNYEERIYWPQDAPPEAWEIKERLNIPDYYVPDFTFTMPDGSKKYHEHLGLMNSESYMETWKKKMILYYWAGVIPGKNLIITADDCHGGIDMQAIMPVIEAELGCLIGTAK